MNEAKELLQKALNIGDKNPATAVMIIRKALKKLEKSMLKMMKNGLTR